MSSKVSETDLEKGVLNNTEWVRRWADGQTPFHQSSHDKFLEEREEEMFGGQTKSVFMPLCGKTLDILWMYGRGHSVCGVEIAEQPVKELYAENGIESEVTGIDNIGKLYQSKDGRLKMYVADIFDLSSDLCGQFDVIWDRRSFVAINLADHQLYKTLLTSLLKSDGIHILCTVEFDPEVWPGPPHSTNDQVVKDIFGETCDIALLQETTRFAQDKSTSSDNVAPTEGKDQKTSSSAPSSETDQSESQNQSASSGMSDLPKMLNFIAALRTSSYVIDRQYKLTLKAT